jgi:lysophospholipase L1-like esterase
MFMRSAWPLLSRRALAALAVLAAVIACSGCGKSPSGAGVPVSYYLALGDSLSQGVQPNTAGTAVETAQGYPDQVYGTLSAAHPGLQLVHLGCPGETTVTMMNGGICRYQAGSQLAAADAFLSAHRGHVLLITIDIGANDPEDCIGPNVLTAAACLGADLPAAVHNLATILAALRTAAGPGAPITGMNYFLPALAEWRHGLTGEVEAWAIEQATARYDGQLDRVYAQAKDQVANVFSAFDTGDFTSQLTVPGDGTLPRNVALICEWTWECTAPPRGPNQHPNQAGYQVIARTVLQASRLR